jgi:hypothetical protein
MKVNRLEGILAVDDENRLVNIQGVGWISQLLYHLYIEPMNGGVKLIERIKDIDPELRNRNLMEANDG